MSTYLSGQPTYLPTVQPFQPNLQMFAGALQFKQNQYDANRKQISDLYGSLLNAQLTRDNNIQARDEFFKTIDYEIKKLAGVDLSLEQNVNQAAGLFNSMYDNKNIVKDMIWTKNYNNQLQRAEGFKNCIDPEKCGGQYWEGGVQAMEYRRQEFRNATDNDAMMMGDVSYTPYVNVQEMASKMFKDLDWGDVKIDSFDGNWIVTTKNGELIEGNLLAQFQKTLGEDPRVKEYYKTKAYLERKNWGASNAFQYGSQEAAEMEYITQTTNAINQSLSRMQTNLEHKKNVTSQIARDAQENLESGDVIYDNEAQGVLNDLFGSVENYDLAEKEVGTAISSVNNSISTRSLAMQAEAIDNAVALMLLDGDLKDASHILAYKNYERTVRINEEAMEYQKHLWRKEEARYAASLKPKDKEEEDENALASLWGDYFAADGTEQEIDIQGAYKQIARDKYESIKAAKTPTTEVLVKTFEAAQATANAGGNGSAQAGADLVAIIDQALKSKVNSSRYSKDQSKYDYAVKLQKKWQSKNAQEKLGWAKQWNMEEFAGNMTYDAIKKTYSSSVSGLLKPTTRNQVTRSYLRNVSPQLLELSELADKADLEVKQWDELKNQLSQNVAQYAAKYGGENGGLFKYLTNDLGNIRSADQFAFKAAMGETMKDFGGFEGKTPLQRYKESGENISAYISQARSFWNDRMPAEYKKRYGNDVNKYIDEQLAERVKYNTNYNPTVRIKKKDGSVSHVFVSDFFTPDGMVRSKYQQYSKSWKPGEQSEFWTNYRKSRELYTGERDLTGQKTGKGETAWYEDVGNWLTGASYSYTEGVARAQKGAAYDPRMIIANMINQDWVDPNAFVRMGQQKAKSDVEKTLKSKTFSSPFLNTWKAFHTMAIDVAQEKGLLKGLGSFVTQNLSAFVDYDKPTSKPVVYEASYLKNAFAAETTGDAIFSFGGPQGSLPANDPQAATFIKKIISEAIAKKGLNPKWVGTYNAIGGGRSDWQQYTIDLSDPAIAKAYGQPWSKDIPGVTPQLAGSTKVTIYLKDKAADNALHYATKKSSLEKRLDYSPSGVRLITGQYDDMHTLKIQRTSSGSYVVKGNILQGIQNGEKKWLYINDEYPEKDVSPDILTNNYSLVLQNIRSKMR